jgi:hypothetical protein
LIDAINRIKLIIQIKISYYKVIKETKLPKTNKQTNKQTPAGIRPIKNEVQEDPEFPFTA